MDSLHHHLIDFIKPFVEGPQPQRESNVRLALSNSPVLDHLDWGGGAIQFAAHLLQTVRTYGQADDLCRLLTGLARYAGGEQQATAERLCRELKGAASAGSTPVDTPSLPDPSPNPRLRDHIFISYATTDRPFVERLAEDLRRRGYIVWIDFSGIRGGEVWRQSIVDGIHASAVMLVVVTPNGVKSEWVALEVRTAKEFEKPIIPLRVENLSASEEQAYASLELSAIQYRDFRVGYDTALPDLLADLPKPQAGLPGYCQKLIARLAEAPWASSRREPVPMALKK